MQEEQKKHELRLHSSAAMRMIFAALGFVSLGVGIIGIFLPLLPTTVFILLAAYCFARSSQRFYSALLGNRHFGPTIRDWQEHRCISRKSKAYAITLIVFSFGATVVFFLDDLYVRGLLAAGGILLILYLKSLPTCGVKS